MNTDNMKYVEIEGRKFQIKKFDARVGLGISKIVIAKLLPVADSFLPALISGEKAALKGADTLGSILENISMEGIAKALDLIEEKDLNLIIDKSLSHCYEKLAAGLVQVMGNGGVFNVAGIEDDLLLMLRLTAEAVLWSVGGFFDGSRWTSMFSPLASLFKQDA